MLQNIVKQMKIMVIDKYIFLLQIIFQLFPIYHQKTQIPISWN